MKLRKVAAICKSAGMMRLPVRGMKMLCANKAFSRRLSAWKNIVKLNHLGEGNVSAMEQLAGICRRQLGKP